LIERGATGAHEIIPLGRPEFDLAGDAAAIVATFERVKPDAIVSAAAYTAVDRAEAERGLAFAVNQAGAGAVAAAAQRLDIPLVHLSTDYVFDGEKPEPYVETDMTGPTGVYGLSKLAGEEAVLSEHDNVAILRTAWVYSPFGSNFVKTMLRLAKDREEVGVVSDQRGNPTSALDIADGILKVVENMGADSRPGQRGIFHMTGSGGASWAKFAEAIFAASLAAGGPSARVKPIATADYPTPARRPRNSRLACDKLALAHGVKLPDWRRSTADIVARLVRGDA
jgi:dTDP-4-dehydrorhamnose reductase